MTVDPSFLDDEGLMHTWFAASGALEALAEVERLQGHITPEMADVRERTRSIRAAVEYELDRRGGRRP